MRDEFSIFRAWFVKQHHYSGLWSLPADVDDVVNAGDELQRESAFIPTQFETDFIEFSELAALPDKPDWTAAEVEALGAKICAFASRMASATCVWLMMIAEFDRQEGWSGTKSCAHWLSWACSVSPGTAREHVRVARTMMQMPRVLEEFGRGRLSYSKVRELTRIHTSVPEQELLDLARIMTASQLAKSVRGFRRNHPDRLQQELRRRTRWYTDNDGSVVLQARLPAEEGALLVAALESAHDLLEKTEQERLRTEVSPGPGPGPSPARVSQSEALLHLATLQLDTAPAEVSGADRHLVVVHVDSRLLAAATPEEVEAPNPISAIATAHNDCAPAAASAQPDPETDVTSVPALGACTIQGVGGISPQSAARIACDAVVTTMVRAAGGAVLAHGRKYRLVQSAQRRALMVRDGQCRHPGCDRVTYLEAHHVTHWAQGGRTDLDNLILLCRFHHMACHEGGVGVAAGSGSRPGLPRWEFRSPDGDVLSGNQDQIAATTCADENLLWNGIDEISDWDHAEAERIRPLWAGERFSLPDVLGHLYSYLPVESMEAAS